MNRPNKPHAINHAHRRCGQKQQANDTSIDSLGLSNSEYAVLMAARYFFASYAQPNSAAWMTVILASDDFFPTHSDSASVVQGILAVVHEIRISRKSTLRFSNPHCLDCANVVTAEERHLVSVLRAMRDGRTSTASTHALLLCEGNEIDGFLQATEKLMRRLDGCGSRAVTS